MFVSTIINRKIFTKLPRINFGHGIRKFCEQVGIKPEKKGIILGVYDYDAESEEPAFTESAQKFNSHLGGKLTEIIKQSGAKMGLGRTVLMNNINNEYWSLVLVGLGPQKAGYNELEALHQGMENVRVAAGIGAQRLHQQRVDRILTEGFGYPEQAGEGTALALWRYQQFRSKDSRKKIPSIELFDGTDEDAFQRGLFKAESQNLARRLTNTPANHMTPLQFAQETVNELCPCGIKVVVRNRDWIESNQFNVFLTVAKGSCEPPILLEISYCGGPPDIAPILMVGKGITFDSGGLCLKRYRHTDYYKCDMSGAACVISAIRGAAAFNLPINIEAIIPLCENMPSGMAMKCGDILTAKNGKTVMITDTDNEGQLLLIDPLVHGQRLHRPRLVIDVATLTSGVSAALGSGASGVFTNSQTMWKQVRKAGIITGDRVWRLPLYKQYTHKVTKFTSHDVDNVGWDSSGEPGLAAAFIQEFIDCVDWIHWDTKGVGFITDNKVYPYLTKGMASGRPTRTIMQLLHQLSCPPEAERKL